MIIIASLDSRHRQPCIRSRTWGYENDNESIVLDEESRMIIYGERDNNGLVLSDFGYVPVFCGAGRDSRGLSRLFAPTPRWKGGCGIIIQSSPSCRSLSLSQGYVFEFRRFLLAPRCRTLPIAELDIREGKAMVGIRYLVLELLD